MKRKKKITPKSSVSSSIFFNLIWNKITTTCTRAGGKTKSLLRKWFSSLTLVIEIKKQEDQKACSQIKLCYKTKIGFLPNSQNLVCLCQWFVIHSTTNGLQVCCWLQEGRFSLQHCSSLPPSISSKDKIPTYPTKKKNPNKKKKNTFCKPNYLECVHVQISETQAASSNPKNNLSEGKGLAANCCSKCPLLTACTAQPHALISQGEVCHPEICSRNEYFIFNVLQRLKNTSLEPVCKLIRQSTLGL